MESPEGKKPLGRSRSRWEDNVGLEEIGYEGVDYIESG
jgi:hypothetical protein